MQTGGRLIEDIDGLAGRAFGQLGRQLGALRFTAGQRRGGLTQLDIAETDLAHRLQSACDLGHVGEELTCFIYRHIQHFIDIFALVAHLERLLVVAAPLAHIAGNVNIRQKVHLDFEQAVTRAGLTAAALDIEGETACIIAACLRICRLGEQVADIVEHTRIGRRIGTRRTSDGRLVNVDDLVEILDADEFVMRSCTGLRAVQLRCQLFVQDFIDERGLARTRNTGHTGERAKRNGKVRMLEVVYRTALDRDALAAAFAPDFGHRNEFSARKILSGDGFITFQQLVYRALEHDLAAVAARAGANVYDVVSRKHGVLVMLDHDERVAEVAQPPQGRKQLVVVALVQTDGRLIEDIQYAHQGRADLRRQSDALALAARQRTGRARQRQIFQSDRL